MFFPRRRLCLFILLLAQIVIVLGETRHYLLKAKPEDTTPEVEYVTILEYDLAQDRSIEEYTKTTENSENIETTENAKSTENSESTDTTENAKRTDTSVSANTTSNIIKVNCLTDKVFGPVEMVNTTRLKELLSLKSAATNRTRNDKEGRQIPGTCMIVLIYAKWCVFSSQAAPHFNALPRSFPHLKAVALDAMEDQSFTAQFGIVAVPTLILVHSGKPVSKYTGNTHNIKSFAAFITEGTNLQPNGSLYTTSLDFSGPVSSVPSNETDYCLVLSWAFIAACAIYFTLQSRWWKQFVELVQNTWRESNAQHEHVD